MVHLIDVETFKHVKEKRKKEREEEEKRLASERAAEDARRKAEEVDIMISIGLLILSPNFPSYILLSPLIIWYSLDMILSPLIILWYYVTW